MTTLLFEKFKNILESESGNIRDRPISEAIEDIKVTVKRLVAAADLPNFVATKYEEFSKEEMLLYKSDFYRDHFLHPYQTFLLGYITLKRMANTKSAGYKIDDELLRKWLLVALWHDITYIAQEGTKWWEGLIKKSLAFEIKANQNWGPTLSDIDCLMAIDRLSHEFIESGKKTGDTDQDEMIRLLFRTWLNNQIMVHTDHGVLSALYLQRTAKVNGWDKDKKMGKKFVDECSLAIAMHNYHRSYPDNTDETGKGRKEKNYSAMKKTTVEKIGDLNIDKYPLAYLLTYCDTVQEWGRPGSPGKIRPSNFYKYYGIDVSEYKVTAHKVTAQLTFNVDHYIFAKNDDCTDRTAKKQIMRDLIKKDDNNNYSKIRSIWYAENWAYFLDFILTEGLKDADITRNVEVVELSKLKVSSD